MLTAIARNSGDRVAASLTLAELAAALAAIGGFEARPLIAVAVSGGADSLALMLLADRWARQHGGRAWGLSVDHGLRPESAAEARTVAGWLGAQAIPHAILAWRGDKPASGIQAAARDARYRLLAEWCRQHGVLHLLTAHHREDQAETHLIRRRAGSGIDGLAAMSAVRELPGCRLVRPLLGVPRARLAALLAAEGQPFLSDPSNRNPAFERARLRTASDALAGAALDAVIAETRDSGRRRVEREHALAQLLGRAVALHPAGFAVLDPAVFGAADADAAERLLGRAAACIGGAPHPARLARLTRLRAALADAPERARTLGSCRFVPWRNLILVLRELAAVGPPVAVAAGAVWDGRFTVAPAPSCDGLTLGCLGQSGLGLPSRGAMAAPTIPRFAHPVLPAFWDREGLAAVPHLGYRRAGLARLPALAFRPAQPLGRAGFTVV